MLWFFAPSFQSGSHNLKAKNVPLKKLHNEAEALMIRLNFSDRLGLDYKF
jgi:hypothetical protein